MLESRAKPTDIASPVDAQPAIHPYKVSFSGGNHCAIVSDAWVGRRGGGGKEEGRREGATAKVRI